LRREIYVKVICRKYEQRFSEPCRDTWWRESLTNASAGREHLLKEVAHVPTPIKTPELKFAARPGWPEAAFPAGTGQASSQWPLQTPLV
jgi:hypothetical protein